MVEESSDTNTNVYVRFSADHCERDKETLSMFNKQPVTWKIDQKIVYFSTRKKITFYTKEFYFCSITIINDDNYYCRQRLCFINTLRKSN